MILIYRYNLITFADKGEYGDFLKSVIEDDRQYFLPDLNYVSGKKIKIDVSGGTITGKNVLTQDYIRNILLLDSGFESAASEIYHIVTKIFSGDSFSWLNDTLPAIEKMQHVMDRYGPYLPDLADLPALLESALQHMQRGDTYAFCDILILLERYLGDQLDFIRQDIQCLREFGCFDNA